MEGALLQQIQDMYYYADLQGGKWVNDVRVNFSILFESILRVKKWC